MPYSWGEELPALDGARVRLRSLRGEDAATLFAIFGDPEVTRYWSSPPLGDMAGALSLLDDIRRHFDARTLFQWGVARRDDDAIIGTCTILHIDEDHRRGEIGFALRRAHWGHRYATEAVAMLTGFAFAQLDLHRLEADVDPQNAASIAVLERQGFRREGLLRERYFLNGEAQDAAYYGLLRREWTGAEDDIQ